MTINESNGISGLNLYVNKFHLFQGHTCILLAYNNWPPSAQQRNDIRMALRWWADSGPIL